MVLVNHLRDRPKKWNVLEYFVACLWVLTNHLHLERIEFAGFRQYLSRNGDFTNIVHHAPKMKATQTCSV